MSLANLLQGAAGDLRKAAERASAIMDVARSMVVDAEVPLDHRLLGVPVLGRGLGRRSEDLELLAGLLSPQQPLALQSAAVQELSQHPQEHIAGLLLSNWKQLSPQVQSEVLSVLLSRRAWHEQLLRALEKGDVRPNDLDASSYARLLDSGDDELRRQAAAVLGNATSADRGDVIERYREVQQLTGDPQRGADKFQATCAACHRHNGIGNEFGPELAALSDKSDEALLEAILDPNRAIENKYKSYTCVTVDGRVLSGMILSESASSITLAQPDGTRQTLLRVDIEELSSTGVSFMPVGLEQGLKSQDVADLLAFIRHDGRLGD